MGYRCRRPRVADSTAVAWARGMTLAAAACAVTLPPAATVAEPTRSQAMQLSALEFLEQYAATKGFTLGQPTAIEVTPEGDAVLFLRSGPRSFVQSLYQFDTRTAREAVLLSADSLLGGHEEDLSPEERARRERMRMAARGIAAYSLSRDGRTLLVPLSGRLFLVERSTRTAREIVSRAGYPIDPQLSPDGKRLACVRDGDLYVTDVASGVETRLTTGGGGEVNHGLAEFAAQEEMGRFRGFWWSPDSATLAYEESNTTGMQRFFVADPADPAKEPTGRPYPRTGGKNAEVRLGLVSARGGNTTWVEWDREAFPYLAAVRWEENAPLTILIQNREQTEEHLLAVDAANGKTTQLLVETDAAWINLVPRLPKWLASGRGFLWMSERGGAWQLELRERSGKLQHVLTPPDFGLMAVADVDEDSKSVIVIASPKPTEKHLWRVGLDPGRGAPVRLSEEPGVHDAFFGRGHSVYVHSSSTWAGESRWTVRKRGGEVLGQLQSAAESPPFLPQMELVKVGDNPAFHARITRPRRFDSARKYPVLVQVYGGPRAQMVLASRAGYLLQQWYADQGFLVVALDCRGTPNRGREWERAIKGNLIDLPLDDQVAGLQALGRRFPEMDLGRVGIYGWSFGGYFAAHAVMRRPEVYRAAVIGAPVSDWLDYDTHYTERYMGLPEKNAAGYTASSVLTYAGNLERPALIIHGTDDDNVYFVHSLKLANALFRAGKPYEFVPLSGFTHMVPDPQVTVRLQSRMAAFFLQHLTGEPSAPPPDVRARSEP